MNEAFHPSDIAFVQHWSDAAPGFGGWRLDPLMAEHPGQVRVIPPGAEQALFLIARRRHDVIMFRLSPSGGTAEEIGRYANVRVAVQALCPLDGDVLEDINLRLEHDFPRDPRRDLPPEIVPDRVQARR